MNTFIQVANIVFLSIIVGVCFWAVGKWKEYGRGVYLTVAIYLSTLIPLALLLLFHITTSEQNRSISFVLRIIAIIALANVIIRGKK